ncbi:MAG: hypothetical protein H7841_12190 [Magnetospirillum sp. WYHS-4]
MSAAPRVNDMGLVYAFSVAGGKATAILADSAAADEADYVWYHVNLATEPGRRWLDGHAGLPPQLVSSLVDRSEEPGAYPFGTGLMLVLEDRLREFDHNTQELSELHVWIEPRRVITLRWHPLSATDRLRFRLEVGGAPATAMALSIDLMGEIVTDIEGIAGRTRDRLDVLEDRVLDDVSAGIAGELGAIRREAIKLRRRILPLREVASTLVEADLDWIRPEDRQRLDPLQGRIDRAGSGIIECQEQARLLQDEVTARAAERNGRNLYILSVLTAVLLPLNLVTGVFGMNVAGLPGLHDDLAFFWVMLGMVAVGVGAIAVFKLNRWF